MPGIKKLVLLNNQKGTGAMLKRRFILLSLLICGTLIIQSAQAALDWQEGSIHSGTSYRQIEIDSGFLAVHIDFAVFDTEANPDAWGGENGFNIPGGGQYVYAYQIFNDEGYSTEALGSFSLLTEGGEYINGGGIMGTSWENDMTGQDIAPEDTPTESSWAFNGLFVPSKYSSFLVISSDHSWVKGDYELGGYEEPDFPVTDEISIDALQVPEPTTIMLLGVGGLAFFKKSRRKK